MPRKRPIPVAKLEINVFLCQVFVYYLKIIVFSINIGCRKWHIKVFGAINPSLIAKIFFYNIKLKTLQVEIYNTIKLDEFKHTISEKGFILGWLKINDFLISKIVSLSFYITLRSQVAFWGGHCGSTHGIWVVLTYFILSGCICYNSQNRLFLFQSCRQYFLKQKTHLANELLFLAVAF